MVLFSVATFVIFHFALNRATIDGPARRRGADRDAAVRRDARRSTGCSSPSASRAASTRFLLAPVDRTALLVAKAAALFVFLVVLELSRCRRSRVLLLGPVARAAAARPGRRAGAGRRRARGDRDARLGDRRPDPRPRPDRPDHRAAAADPGADRRPPAAAGRCSPPTARARRQASGWRSWLSMIWCSPSSPTRCSTSCWRTDVCDHLRARPARPLPRHHRHDHASRWRWCSSTRRWTPTRASSRRSSTSTCRWRSSRCAGSSSAACSRSATCAPATAAGTCAPTWRSTCR